MCIILVDYTHIPEKGNHFSITKDLGKTAEKQGHPFCTNTGL